MVSWLLENFPETAHVSNSNGDQIVHFAAAEGVGLCELLNFDHVNILFYRSCGDSEDARGEIRN